MGTLYRKVAVSERLPPPMTDVLIKYRWNGYFEPYHYVDDLHCKDEMLNEVTHWIEEIPYPTAQLQSDKAELLEALEKVKRLEPIICMGGAVAEQWQNEAQALNEMMAEIESLIQKHKKCQEKKPR